MVNKLGFSKRISTKISQDCPSESNPFLTEQRLLAGYDQLDLAQHSSFVSALFLLFKGELPSKNDEKLLETLFIGLINLGARHSAVRAAMVAGISKTNAEHILPIGLLALGGEKGGANEVALAYNFIKSSYLNKPKDVISSDITVAGFGRLYDGVDPFSNKLACLICKLRPESPVFAWCTEFNSILSERGNGWLLSGISAAVFIELGIGKREAIGLFQLACSPGVFAHGVEQTHKPITDMPMLEDEQYELK